MKDEDNQIQTAQTFNAKKTLFDTDRVTVTGSAAESEAEAIDQSRKQAQSQVVDDGLNPKLDLNDAIPSLLPTSSNHQQYSISSSSTNTTKRFETDTSPPTSTSTSTTTSSSSPSCPPHLNPHSIIIKNTSNSGRGLFATHPIKAGTLLEVSPVLIFPAEEYSSFGRFTRLDDYTFVWKKGQGGRHDMALALGLGSLFNHHPTSPNVSYTLSHSDDSIRYTLIKDVVQGEELCISYGAGRMWWDKEDDTKEKRREKALLEKEKREANDAGAEWRKLAGISDSEEEDEEEEEQQRQEDDAEEDKSSTRFQAIIPYASALSSKKLSNSSQANGSVLKPQAQKISSVLLPRDSTSKAAATSASQSSIPRNPPLFRVTSALDPAEAPLVLVNAWAIDVPPRLSNHVLQWIKVNSMALSRRSRRARSNRRVDSGSTSEGSSNSNDTDSYEEEDEEEEDDDSEECGDEDWDYDPDRGVKHLRAFRRSNNQDRKNPGVLTALLCLESSGPDRDTIVRLLRSRDGNKLESRNGQSQDEGSGEENSSRKPSTNSPLSTDSQPRLKNSPSNATSLTEELQRELGSGKERIKIKPSNSLPVGYDPEPYLVSVPAGPAPSKARLMEWCSHWPVVIRHGIDPLSLAGSSGSGTSTPVNNGNGNCSPASSSSSLPASGGLNPHPFVGPSLGLVDRVADAQSWTDNRILWAKESFKHVIRLARLAKENGQLPIAAHVTPSFNAGEDFPFHPRTPSSSNSSPASMDETERDSAQTTNSLFHGSTGQSKSSFNLPRSYLKSDAWDTRIREGNPIKHAVINVVKEVAEKRAEKDRTSNVWNNVVTSDAVRGDYEADSRTIQTPSSLEGSESEPPHFNGGDQNRDQDVIRKDNSTSSNQSPKQRQQNSSRSSSPSSSPSPQSRNFSSTSKSNHSTTSTTTPTNSHPKDQDYLLTTLSLFVTHEPCAHCCMALVHSRVKAVYFLLPSPGSGGCCGANQIRPCVGGEDGGPYALQEERSLNHRFEVWRWVGGMKQLLEDDDDEEEEEKDDGNEGIHHPNGNGTEEEEERRAKRKIQKLLEAGGVDP